MELRHKGVPEGTLYVGLNICMIFTGVFLRSSHVILLVQAAGCLHGPVALECNGWEGIDVLNHGVDHLLT